MHTAVECAFDGLFYAGSFLAEQNAPLVEELGRQDAPALFPQEYRSLLETFEHGEALYHVREDDAGADRYYQLAFQKAEMLQLEVQQAEKQLAAEKTAASG